MGQVDVLVKTNPRDVGFGEQRKYDEDKPVRDVLNALLEETQEKRHQDFGLVLVTQADRVGKWLLNVDLPLKQVLPEKQLGCLILRKKNRPQKLLLTDGTQKVVIIDETKSIRELTHQMAEKANLEPTFFDQFALRVEEDNENCWLDPRRNLREEQCDETQTLVLAKKFFYNEGRITEEHSVCVHLTYTQVKARFVQGDFPLSYEDCLQLTALQLQADGGDYVEGKSKTVNLRERVPIIYHAKKNITKDILNRHKKLSGMTFTAAKLKFMSLIREKTKLFGMTLFEAKERNPDSKKFTDVILLGVSEDGVHRINKETKEILQDFSFRSLQRWASSPSQLTIEEKNSTYIAHTAEAPIIESLITGYHEIYLCRSGKPVPTRLISAAAASSTSDQTKSEVLHAAIAIDKLLDDPDLVKRAFQGIQALEKELIRARALPSFSVVDALIAEANATGEYSFDAASKYGMRRGSPSSGLSNTESLTDGLDSDEELDDEDDETIKSMITSSLEDEKSPWPTPAYIHNRELQYMKKLVKLEGKLRSLQLEKEMLEARVNQTRVGTYDVYIKDLRANIQQLDVASNPQSAKEMLEQQMDKMMLYEDYLQVREEKLKRKATKLMQKNQDLISRESELRKKARDLEGSGKSKSARRTDSFRLSKMSLPFPGDMALPFGRARTDSTDSMTTPTGSPSLHSRTFSQAPPAKVDASGTENVPPSPARSVSSPPYISQPQQQQQQQASHQGEQEETKTEEDDFPPPPPIPVGYATPPILQAHVSTPPSPITPIYGMGSPIPSTFPAHPTLTRSASLGPPIPPKPVPPSIPQRPQPPLISPFLPSQSAPKFPPKPQPPRMSLPTIDTSAPAAASPEAAAKASPTTPATPGRAVRPIPLPPGANPPMPCVSELQSVFAKRGLNK